MSTRQFAGGYVTIDPVQLASLMRSRQGPAARMLMEAGQIVKRGARRRVGVASGALRDRIVVRLVSDGSNGLAVVIIAETDYSLMHHEGTVPHRIEGRPYLAFEPTPGQVVIVRHVDHPGTAPNRFLTDSLDDLKGVF